ncbi:MAG: hypothetical protein ACREIR_00695 [Geminicoccaceae bacterium]
MATALVTFLLAATLAGAVLLFGRDLLDIKAVATRMQLAVLPQVMVQHRRAIWIENLRSAAQVVVYAPQPKMRQDALSKAEQLAANVTDLQTANGAVLTRAWTLIRRAAASADAAERIDAEIRERLHEADSVISDMSANLGSIVEDSAGTLARLIREVLSAGDQDGLSRETLEEVLAINTTSQDLLASLDRGRILLTEARTMTDAAELDQAALHFNGIGRQLTLRVGTLRGNSDYEYLPARIEQFIDLVVIFELRRQWLEARDEAITASMAAMLELGRLRETLHANAADTAEDSVAAITGNVRRIERSAKGGLVALALIGLFVAVSYRQTRQPPFRRAAVDSGDGAEHRADEVARAQLRATLGSLEAFLAEHANLEHLRHNLPIKLKQTASGVLEHIASAGSPALAVAEGAPAGPNGYPYRPCSPRPPPAPVAGPELPLPEQWSVPEVVELVKEIAAESSTAALLAMHESVCAIRRTGREADADGSGAGRRHRPARTGDLALALRALEAATDVAGSTTEQVNLALGEMNALARRANGGDERGEADRTLAEINHKIDGLRAALTATRAMLRSRSSGAA